MGDHHDTIVIGGGQAGLAMSNVLRVHGREHIVLERKRVGDRWHTERWDSLRFQFPNWSLQLPGYRYSGDDPEGFAHYREITRIIEEYAATTDVPIREQTEVVALERGDRGGYVVTTRDGALDARRVVIATGPFQRPFIPDLAEGIPESVHQTDPTLYRGPADLPKGAVLVVGSGASGFQIADELHHAGRTVYLSVSRHRRVPRRFRGRDLYWWLEKLGRFDQTIDSFPSREWPPSTVVTGINGGYDVDVRNLAATGVVVLGRAVAAGDGNVAFDSSANAVLAEADAAYDAFVALARDLAMTDVGDELESEDDAEVGATAQPDVEPVPALNLARDNIQTVIWATGYRYEYDWVNVPVFDTRGHPIHTRGVTEHLGLYFLGLHWMHTFRSGLLSGVGADAAHLAEHMARTR